MTGKKDQKDQKSESTQPEEIREDDSTTDTNAGDDAKSGGIAEQDVTGTAPASNAGKDVDTNAGK